MSKRIMAAILTIVMLLGMFPVTALAEELPAATAQFTETAAAAETQTEESTDPTEEATSGGSAEVTRAQWIQALVAAFSMTVEEDNYPDNYFSDLIGEEDYYRDILVAVEFGVIDLEAGLPFNPDAAATREFAAHTLNFCLGFQLEEAVYSFSEAESVTYPDDIQIAVNRGWFALTDGAFLPDQAITLTEKETMLDDANKIHYVVEIDEEYENSYEFADNVIVIPKDTVASVDGDGIVTIYNCTESIKVGDTFAIYLNQQIPSIYNALSVEKIGDATIIKTEVADESGAIVSADAQGVIDCNQATFTPAEGVTVIETVEQEDGARGKKYIKKTFNKDVELTGGVIVGISVDCEELYIEYLTASQNNGKDYIALKGDLTVDLFTKVDFLKLAGESATVTLGTFGIPGVGEISLVVELDLKGTLTYTYTTYVCAGLEHSPDFGVRTKIEFKKKNFSMCSEVVASIGLKLSAKLNVIVFSGNLYARAGVTSKYTTNSYTDGVRPTECRTFKCWIYATAGYSMKISAGPVKIKEYSDLVTFYDYSNSPVRLYFHEEDGMPVADCARNPGSWYSPSNTRYGSYGSSNAYSTGYNSSGEPYTIFTYDLDDDNNATITGYKGNVATLTIPKTLDGYTVTAIGSGAFKNNTRLKMIIMLDNILTIGDSAFYGCSNLRNLTLSESLTTIGNSAFDNCSSLTTVDIPDTVTTIGTYAFSNCSSLQYVNLSNNLVTLGGCAFYNCDSLASIEIPKSLAETTRVYNNDGGWGYRYGVFYECDGLKNVTFEEGTSQIANGLFARCYGLESIVIPDTVTTIEDQAFSLCTSLKDVTLSNAITLIEGSAFDNCTALESIVIPNSVTSIGTYAFSNCKSLREVTLSKNLVTLGGCAFYNCDALGSIRIPKSLDNTTDVYNNDGGWGYRYGVFYECDGLKNVTFEEGTSQIANGLFARCYGLESIVIPDTVTTIEDQAFSLCTSLKDVTLSNAITLIEGSAFDNCTALESIVIPNSVTSIGTYAFSNCKSLREVTLSKNLVTLGGCAFYNCDSLASIEIPKSLAETTRVYNNDGGWGYRYGVFYECDGLKNVTFEEGTSQIANGLFARCYGLESIVIPDTVTTIEDQAFYICRNLQSVSIPNSVVEIQSSAFRATGLLEVVIPESVTKIGTYVFENCPSLKKTNWPTGVTTIPEYTFNGCVNLSVVDIPDTVTTLNTAVFNNCDALTTIELSDGLTAIGHKVFYDCDALIGLEIPETVTYIGDNVFYDCDALTSITIPYGVTSIGNSAFYDCDALETVDMANSVTSLGTNVFYHNDVLKNVHLSRNLTSIPTGTFKECASLEEIVIPYFTTSIGDNAFNSSPKLTKVVTHDKLTSISSTAFSYPAKTILYGTAGSYTETWATENGYTFVENTSAATAVIPVSTTVRLNKGSTYMLDFDIDPADFCEDITWKSGNTGVATVTEAGLITGVDVGTVKLKVGVGSATASVTVIVEQPVTSLKLNASSLELDVPNTYQLTATIKPDDATNKTLQWTSSDEAVATVDENGLITAIGNGTATITAATTDGTNLSAKCTVKVTDPSNIPVSGITLDVSKRTMEALDTYQLTAAVTPANAANQTILWSSSDESVATVDENGIVTARAKGTATITAASADGTNITATCTVTVTNNAYVVTDPALLESGHPYDVNCTDFWIYTDEGAESLTITFDEKTEMEEGFDYLRIYDGQRNLIGEYTGTELAGATVEIPGDTVKIQIISDEFDTTWGFKVSHVKAVKPDGVYTVSWTQASISLAGDIGVNYYAQLSEDLINAPGAYIQFAVADQIQTVPLTKAEVSTGVNGVTTYRFTCKVAAKQMTEEITGQMYLVDGTAVGDPKVYSVKAYCDAAIPAYSQYEALADLVGLLEAMLNYGGYSQVQFGYNTDDLANAGMNTTLPVLTADDVAAYAHGASGSESGISVASVSLLLESTTTIRFYFNLAGSKSIDEYTFYVDGVETMPIAADNGQYYVDKVDVAAKDLDEMVTVTIGGLTVKYCGLSYVRQVAVLYPNYYSEALVNVAKALYAYNQAANSYFA